MVTQLDYAYQNRIPGILSASVIPGGGYSGAIGIPQMSEANMDAGAINTILGDVGSTYALASAMNIDPYAVLGWLESIDMLSGMNTDLLYGLFDAARSSSEVAQSFIGIDVASTVLGLSGNGAADFTTYLRNRSLESSYNALYDQKSRLMTSITRATTSMAIVPEFPDRSLSVFSNIASEGTIGNFGVTTTPVYGVQLSYNALAGVDSGHFWKLNQNYNAQANQLILQYSAVDSPQRVRLELKNGSGVLVYQTTAVLQQGAEFARLVIDLPNQAVLANVQEIDLVVDPLEGGDATGNFTVHAINFQHLSSAPVVAFTAEPGTPAVTVLPANNASVIGVAELVNSSPSSTLQHTAGTNTFQLHYDLTATNAFAGIVLNFDPSKNGSSINLSAIPNLIFGINSTLGVAKSVKIEIEDARGNTYSSANVDVVAASYYKFLTSLASGKVDLNHVKSIKFSVDQYSVASGTSGDLQLVVGGLS